MSTEAISRQSSHDNPLWQPDGARIAASNLEQFRIRAERHTGLRLPDYAALHRWSV
ncbi:acetoacetyl-CoA synthetase [Brucella vulpis]|nr:acetoacetyl-CoA synthetase [Brucella vulpis]CUW49723.1 acetoacetyl-CoA synthetase [Brucella vulpis]